jgi:phosphoglycolate phosphatase
MPAVVFDWDGTLIDTVPAVMRANEAALGAFGIPVDEARYREAYAPDWRIMYRRLGVAEGDIDAAGRIWREAYESTVATRLFPGVLAALDRLRAAGYRLGIVTAGYRGIVERQLADAGVAGRFDAMVAADDDLPAKPDPAPLRAVLARIGALPDGRPAAGTHYVGDVPDDMRLARAVGVPGIGVASPFWPPDRLLEAGAARVVPSVAAWVDELLDGAAR